MILSAQHLRSFLEVARLGNYTHAAQQLFLSQPGVYQHVRQLETTLGTSLVEQNGKRVVLTQHGREVYEYAQRLAREEDDLLRRLSDDATLASGSINIAAGTTAGEFILPRIGVAFQRAHPGIRMQVTVLAGPSQIDRQVAERRFDIGMHSEPRASDGVTKTPFVTDELIGIAPPGHRFTKTRRPVAARSVATEPLVTFSAGASGLLGSAIIQRMVDSWFEDVGAVPASRLALGSLEGIKTAVRCGAGVGLVSRFAVRDDDASLGTFKLSKAPVRPFVIVTRTGGWESHVVRSFREAVMACGWSGPEQGRQAPRHVGDSPADEGGARNG